MSASGREKWSCDQSDDLDPSTSGDQSSDHHARGTDDWSYDHGLRLSLAHHAEMPSPSSLFVAGLALDAWQWGVIGALYLVFFALPAVWMWRRARADGDAPLTWALLVALGSILGIVEYYHHRSIMKRRAKRAEKVKRPEAEREGR